MKLPVKQMTLMVHSSEFPDVVTKTREEGELSAYVENTGHQPNNLPKDHPGYGLWTYRNKRDWDLLGLGV